MLKFISFGSGSSGNCYYLSTATDGLIIDIGVGIRTLKKQFREYGISLNSVRRIFVTHDHADHIKSVGSFSHDYHVPVYATRLVHQGIDHNYCVQRKVLEELKNVMEINQPVQAGEFLVRSFSVPHDASENVGYEIQVEGVTFVIITDMGSVTEEIKEVISRANYLVIEANHDIEMLKTLTPSYTEPPRLSMCFREAAGNCRRQPFPVQCFPGILSFTFFEFHR